MIQPDMISDYTKQICLSVDGQEFKPEQKFTTTFFDREGYLVHFANLKLYLNLGMELLKVHKVIGFQQKR